MSKKSASVRKLKPRPALKPKLLSVLVASKKSVSVRKLKPRPALKLRLPSALVVSRKSASAVSRKSVPVRRLRLRLVLKLKSASAVSWKSVPVRRLRPRLVLKLLSVLVVSRKSVSVRKLRPRPVLKQLRSRNQAPAQLIRLQAALMSLRICSLPPLSALSVVMVPSKPLLQTMSATPVAPPPLRSKRPLPESYRARCNLPSTAMI